MRNKYGYPNIIPQPSQPMELHAEPMTPQQEAEAAWEAQAEAELHLAAERAVEDEHEIYFV